MANWVLVVADATTLSSHASHLKTRMELVHTVTVVGQAAVTSGSFTGKDGAVIAGDTSSTTVGNAVGSFLSTWAKPVITLNPGAGLIPILGVASGTLAQYRASDAGIGSVNIPDTAYRGSQAAGSNITWYNSSTAGEYIRATYVGTGAVAVAVGTSNAAEYAAVAYAAGSSLAGGTTAAGGRAFITGSGATSTIASTAWNTIFASIMSVLSSSSIPTPTVTAFGRVIPAGSGRQLGARIVLTGDTASTFSWATTDPGGASCFSSTSVRNPTFTPTVSSGTVTNTLTVTGALGGSGSNAADCVIQPAGQQVLVPITGGSLGSGTTDSANAAITAASAATLLADASDTTYYKGTSTTVDVFPLTALGATPGAGTGGIGVDMSFPAGTLCQVTLALVTAATGTTAAQVATGSGTTRESVSKEVPSGGDVIGLYLPWAEASITAMAAASTLSFLKITRATLTA